MCPSGLGAELLQQPKCSDLNEYLQIFQRLINLLVPTSDIPETVNLAVREPKLIWHTCVWHVSRSKVAGDLLSHSRETLLYARLKISLMPKKPKVGRMCEHLCQGWSGEKTTKLIYW